MIWDDGVAPEMALDVDAPHISKWEGLAWWLGGFAFFYAVYVGAKASGHPDLKPTVRALGKRGRHHVARGVLAWRAAFQARSAPRLPCTPRCVTRASPPPQAPRELPMESIHKSLGSWPAGKY